MAEHSSHEPVLSRWPIITAAGAGLIPIGLTAYAHGARAGLGVLGAGLTVVVLGASRWWGELLRERFYGREAAESDARLKTAFALFLLSEAAIFASFFAALFYARAHAATWPPPGMPRFGRSLPAINTGILLLSSLTLTVGHRAALSGRIRQLAPALLVTIALGAIFLCGQAYEYGHLNGASFTLGSGIFGTTFFMLTGFHGLHVLLGIAYLNVVYGAAIRGRLTPDQHFPLTAASWYWHFVDAVWLCVFTVVYIL